MWLWCERWRCFASCLISIFFFHSFLHHRHHIRVVPSCSDSAHTTDRRPHFHLFAYFYACTTDADQVHPNSNKLFILFIIYILNRWFSLRARSNACMFSLKLFSFSHVMINDLESIIYFKIEKGTRKKKIQSFALARNKNSIQPMTRDERLEIGLIVRVL